MSKLSLKSTSNPTPLHRVQALTLLLSAQQLSINFSTNSNLSNVWTYIYDIQSYVENILEQHGTLGPGLQSGGGGALQTFRYGWILVQEVDKKPKNITKNIK